MTRYKITLEYDGTDLIGWQENTQGPSVQSLVRDAIFKFCAQRVTVHGAGRTDAGVHAFGMVAHFDITSDETSETVKRALNFYLMNSPVTVLDCKVVSDDFHARFSCKGRNYRYVILARNSPPVLDKKVWWVPRPLDIQAMRSAAEKLVGNHDFTSFRATECQAKSPIKTLDKVNLGQKEDYIILEFSARSFLHHQVRNMVGTLVQIGLGKDFDIEKIFDARKRSAAGPTAPASGLYFHSADY